MNQNLLDIIGADTTLKRTSGTRGGEYHGPCPFCADGGKDRFWVHPHHGTTGVWKCRVCDRGGDAYRYIMERDGVGFRKAKEIIDGEPPAADTKRSAPRRPAEMQHERKQSDDPNWQATVIAFVERCAAVGESSPELQPLLKERGISADVAAQHKIGWCPKQFELNGLDFWAGAVIPCFGSVGDLRYVKVRTGPGQYFHIRGGDGSAVYLLPSLPLNPRNGVGWTGKDVVIVETELDALMLRSVTRALKYDPIVPLALGTAKGGRHYADAIISNAHKVFIALDADTAGDTAATYWIDRGASRLRPTGAKDPGDMYANEGADGILQWLAAGGVDLTDYHA